MFKSLSFCFHNRRAVGKIVGNETYDVTVCELKKCEKFETVETGLQFAVSFRGKQLKMQR